MICAYQFLYSPVQTINSEHCKNCNNSKYGIFFVLLPLFMTFAMGSFILATNLEPNADDNPESSDHEKNESGTETVMEEEEVNSSKPKLILAQSWKRSEKTRTLLSNLGKIVVYYEQVE